MRHRSCWHHHGYTCISVAWTVQNTGDLHRDATRTSLHVYQVTRSRAQEHRRKRRGPSGRASWQGNAWRKRKAERVPPRSAAVSRSPLRAARGCLSKRQPPAGGTVSFGEQPIALGPTAPSSVNCAQRPTHHRKIYKSTLPSRP